MPYVKVNGQWLAFSPAEHQHHVDDVTDAVESQDIAKIKVVTESEYDALDPPDAETFYIITEDD